MQNNFINQTIIRFQNISLFFGIWKKKVSNKQAWVVLSLNILSIPEDFRLASALSPTVNHYYNFVRKILVGYQNFIWTVKHYIRVPFSNGQANIKLSFFNYFWLAYSVYTIYNHLWIQLLQHTFSFIAFKHCTNSKSPSIWSLQTDIVKSALSDDFSNGSHLLKNNQIILPITGITDVHHFHCVLKYCRYLIHTF